MIGRYLALATAAALWATPVLGQDSFGAPGQQQGAFPQAQQGQGYGQPQGQQGAFPPQQGAFPQQQGYPQQGYPQQGALPQQQGAFPQQQQGYPQQGSQQQQANRPQGTLPPAQQGQGYGQPPASALGSADLDRMMQWERQDFGVPPTDRLHAGPMHGPTPASIPGGQVITTKGLLSLVGGGQTRYLLFDVLGGAETIPGSLLAVPAHQPGRFDDQIQQQFGAYLQQATGGNREMPLVFYCLSSQCWMSYNAALRAIHLGHTNVLWYRGGLEAWQMAGQPTRPTQAGYGQAQR